MNIPNKLVRALLNSLEPEDNITRLFLSVQIFENEIHYKKVRKYNDLFEQNISTQDSFYKIYELLSSVSSGHMNTIHLYPDEYLKVEDMFNQTIEYFESLEEYEKCHDLIFSKNRIFFCIKIIT